MYNYIKKNCILKDCIVRYELLSKEHEKQIKETNEYKNTRNSLETKIKDLEKKNGELSKKNDLNNGFSDRNKILEERFQQKAKECLQLTQHLQAARDENTKNVCLIFYVFF